VRQKSVGLVVVVRVQQSNKCLDRQPEQRQHEQQQQDQYQQQRRVREVVAARPPENRGPPNRLSAPEFFGDKRMMQRGVPPDLLERLFRAWRSCVAGKPQIKRSAFCLHYEDQLVALAADLRAGTWRPGISQIFVVTTPKPREVIAASLRDRVVHHLLYQHMEAYWERRFLPNSYACRVGKGPLQASKDFRAWVLRRQRGGGAANLWTLKVDIANFFPTIDQHVLFGILLRHVTNEFWLGLCEQIVFHDPTRTGSHQIRSPRGLWKVLPRHKSLFNAPAGKGLPIGNLTSQFFANIYLNELDQYIAREIRKDCRVLFWQRYVDDLLFVSEDRRALVDVAARADGFLRQRLLMELNPTKTVLQPFARGVDHLGWFHKESCVRLRNRVKRDLVQWVEGLARVNDVMPYGLRPWHDGGRLGYLKHGDTGRPRESLIERSGV